MSVPRRTFDAHERVQSTGPRSPRPLSNTAKPAAHRAAYPVHSALCMRHLMLLLLLAGCGVGEILDDERPELDSDNETDNDGSDELAIKQSTNLAFPITLGGHVAWAHFTNPEGVSSGVDHNILDEAIRLIRKTPKDATIRAAIHSLTVAGI